MSYSDERDAVVERFQAMLDRHGVSPGRFQELERSGILDDVFDPASRIDSPDAVRHALRLDQVITRKTWNVRINWDLTIDRRIADMLRANRGVDLACSKGWLLKFVESEYPSPVRGVSSIVCESWRCRDTVFRDRFLEEMRRADVEFAGFDELVALITTYGWKKLFPLRGPAITTRDKVYRREEPLNFEGLQWKRYDEVMDFGRALSPWREADLLVVRRQYPDY